MKGINRYNKILDETGDILRVILSDAPHNERKKFIEQIEKDTLTYNKVKDASLMAKNKRIQFWKEINDVIK